MMRPVWITFIFCLLLSSNLWGAIWSVLHLKDGSFLSGEKVETYEDRWFWESSAANRGSYILLFSSQKLRLVDLSKIQKEYAFTVEASSWTGWLEEKGIILREHPVRNARVLTGHEGHHKFERMYGNFAWDLGIMDETGKTHSGDGLELEDYYIFGKPVFSPLAGTVVGLQGHHPDNAPSPGMTGDLSGRENNYLTIKVDDFLYLSLVHFRKDSLAVVLGEDIEEGQLLGQVGNSGISYLPHLHYTLYAYIPEFDRFVSVPIPMK